LERHRILRFINRCQSNTERKKHEQDHLCSLLHQLLPEKAILHRKKDRLLLLNRYKVNHLETGRMKS
jgi:hypothetical protein